MPIAGEDRAKREEAVGTMRQGSHQDSNCSAAGFTARANALRRQPPAEAGFWRSAEIRLADTGQRLA